MDYIVLPVWDGETDPTASEILSDGELFGGSDPGYEYGYLARNDIRSFVKAAYVRTQNQGILNVVLATTDTVEPEETELFCYGASIGYGGSTSLLSWSGPSIYEGNEDMKYTVRTEQILEVYAKEGVPIYNNVNIALDYMDDSEWWEEPKIDISGATIEEIPDQTYTGEEITPMPIITYDDIELEELMDYMLSYENNVEVGVATVVATGIGDYEGTKTQTFNIVAPGPGPGPEPEKERKVRKMNGGYIMVDCEGLDLTATESQTVTGLYKALKTAKGTDKPVYAYNCIYDDMEVSPIHVFLTELTNGNIVGTASVLQVIVAEDDTVTINSMIAG